MKPCRFETASVSVPKNCGNSLNLSRAFKKLFSPVVTKMSIKLVRPSPILFSGSLACLDLD